MYRDEPGNSLFRRSEKRYNAGGGGGVQPRKGCPGRREIMISIVKTYQDGVSRELALEAVEEGAWISMVSPSRGEMESVGSATGVPFDVLAAALTPRRRRESKWTRDISSW